MVFQTYAIWPHMNVFDNVAYPLQNRKLPRDEIRQRVIYDLNKLKLIKKDDILDTAVRSFRYAYVIYDLDHRKNTDRVLSYMSDLGIACCGRFSEPFR